MKILFEDSSIVVCIKPAGVLSQGGEGSDMISLLGEHFAAAGQPAQAYPVHRLDRETAGLMVYAKSAKAAAGLSAQAAQSEIKKRYFAVVHGCPEQESAVLTDLLFRDKQRNKTYIVSRMRKGVREAKLEYRVVGKAENLTLLDIRLFTGRTHQIRVQFAGRKMPLFGDGRYGGGSGGLALFSHGLEFRHPISGEKLAFTAQPQTDSCPWSLFQMPLNTDEWQ